MTHLLKEGQELRTVSSNLRCVVEKYLGGGGQGEVYRAEYGGKPTALKWYYPDIATERLREALDALIRLGSPTDRFLWPMELVVSRSMPGFGYVMPLRDPSYKGLMDLMKRRVDPSFRALCTAGFYLADGYLQLHSKGYSYQDISHGNVFLEPASGKVLICDNDNVVVDGETSSGVFGTPRFMAPEIVRGEAMPSTLTDIFSLAVLLFYMFHIHHPLEGRLEHRIHCLDSPAMKQLYGDHPVFIFDPNDQSNRPVPGEQDNPLLFWPIYPRFFRDLFTDSFTKGIRSPGDRIRESQWRNAMIQLRDSIIYCGPCGKENFYDAERLVQRNEGAGNCWSCRRELVLPPRLRIADKFVVMLNHDTVLYPHHLDPDRRYDFDEPTAAVTQHPCQPGLWGLKNLTADEWTLVEHDGEMTPIPSGRTASLSECKIRFGKLDGEIRA